MRPDAIHWFDHVAGVLARRRRLFADGWGDERFLERVPLVARFEEPPRPALVTWDRPERRGGLEITNGSFPSAFPWLPPEARRAHVRRISPLGPEPERRRPVYVVPPSSGDEGFATRTRLFGALAARDGIELILLESAMYGLRRPHGQHGASIRTVAEHLCMNLSTIVELRDLVEHLWARGHDRVGFLGFSMGGSSAALAAAVTPRPLALAVLAAGRSVVPTMTEGLLSDGIDFTALGGEAARARLGALFGGGDLDRHPRPSRLDAAIIVGARLDGYVFTRQIEELHALWPASELRWLDTGHAGAFVRHGAALRQAAIDSMRRLDA